MVITRSNINSRLFCSTYHKSRSCWFKRQRTFCISCTPLATADPSDQSWARVRVYWLHYYIRDYFLVNLKEATINLFNHEPNPTAGHQDWWYRTTPFMFKNLHSVYWGILVQWGNLAVADKIWKPEKSLIRLRTQDQLLLYFQVSVMNNMLDL